jgi:hypothetical protein
MSRCSVSVDIFSEIRKAQYKHLLGANVLVTLDAKGSRIWFRYRDSDFRDIPGVRTTTISTILLQLEDNNARFGYYVKPGCGYNGEEFEEFSASYDSIVRMELHADQQVTWDLPRRPTRMMEKGRRKVSDET